MNWAAPLVGALFCFGAAAAVRFLASTDPMENAFFLQYFDLASRRTRRQQSQDEYVRRTRFWINGASGFLVLLGIAGLVAFFWRVLGNA